MENVNLRSAMSNLTQVDRLQSSQHDAPVNSQIQNAQIAQDKAVLHAQRPNATEGLEGKKVDGNDKRERDNNSSGGKKKEDRRNKKGQGTGIPIIRRGSDGHFVDFSA